MKKRLLIILFSLFCVSSFAQTISFRDDRKDVFAAGTDYLITNFYGKYDSGVSLTVYIPKQAGEKKCIIGIYSEGNKTETQENSRAVFKSFSGNIITLKQSNESGVQNAILQLGNYQSNTWALKVHYDISEEDLNTLMNEGVAVLRIETLAGIREYIYDKDYLGGFLRSELDLINEKKSFENDF